MHRRHHRDEGDIQVLAEEGFLYDSSIFPVLLDRLPKDPWGGEYQYLNPGIQGEIDILSYGADNKPGGESYNADIGSWDLGNK